MGTKITGITVRDLVDSEKALEMLASRQMEGKVGYRIAKIIRKSAPDIRQFRKGLQELIEGLGKDAYIREGNGIGIDPSHEKYEENVKKVEKHRASVLDVETALDGGVGPVKLQELLDALPKRNVGTAEDPKLVQAYIEPSILADLWWAIEEK